MALSNCFSLIHSSQLGRQFMIVSRLSVVPIARLHSFTPHKSECMNELYQSQIERQKEFQFPLKLCNLKTCRFYTQNWIYVLNKLTHTQISLFRMKVQRRHCHRHHRCCCCCLRHQHITFIHQIVTF